MSNSLPTGNANERVRFASPWHHSRCTRLQTKREGHAVGLRRRIVLPKEHSKIFVSALCVASLQNVLFAFARHVVTGRSRIRE